jgi:hypothetical protein
LPISFKNQTITTTEREKMKKTLLALLSATLLFTVITPAQAEDQKVLAIIDTAIDSTKFSSVIHEVCFTTVKSTDAKQNMACPNGELFMEGKGAASAPWPKSASAGVYHGTTMVNSALALDKSIKIVFLRVHNVNILGNNSTPADGTTILSAMNWVQQNASKYSIDAVSISQSGIYSSPDGKTKALHYQCGNASFSGTVAQLSATNVPVFAATGNDALSSIVGFPACVPGVIGVGTLVDQKEWTGETATNRGSGLDLVANSNGQGSSVATAVASSTYVLKNTYKSYPEYFNSLPKKTVKYCIRPVGKTSGCSGVYDFIANTAVILK